LGKEDPRQSSTASQGSVRSPVAHAQATPTQCTGHPYPMYRPPLPNVHANPTQCTGPPLPSPTARQHVPGSRLARYRRTTFSNCKVQHKRGRSHVVQRMDQLPPTKTDHHAYAAVQTRRSHTHPQLPSRGPVIRHSGRQGAGRWSGVGLLTLQLSGVVVDTLYGAKLQAWEAAGGGEVQARRGCVGLDDPGATGRCSRFRAHTHCACLPSPRRRKMLRKRSP
jgi:hypothetical protein